MVDINAISGPVRSAQGHYVAIVSGVQCDNRCGSWLTTPDQNGIRREVLPKVAEILQSRIPRSDRGRR